MIDNTFTQAWAGGHIHHCLQQGQHKPHPWLVNSQGWGPALPSGFHLLLLKGTRCPLPAEGSSSPEEQPRGAAEGQRGWSCSLLSPGTQTAGGTAQNWCQHSESRGRAEGAGRSGMADCPQLPQAGHQESPRASRGCCRSTGGEEHTGLGAVLAGTTLGSSFTGCSH